MSPEVVATGRQALEGVRAVTRRRRGRPRPVKAFLRLVADRALGVRAAVRLPVRADRDDRARRPACDWVDLLLITVAMVGARTFAMAANRIIDRHIDARNPRTAKRELVTGAVSVRTAWTGAAVALVVFLVAAAAAQPAVPGARAARRGAAGRLPVRQAVHQLAARDPRRWPRRSARSAPGSAVTGTFAGSGPAWVLGAAVGLWIGGFDLIYACQDAEVDRRDRRAQRAGPLRRARSRCALSTVAHVVTFGLFVWFGALVGLGWLWWIGLALTAAAFVYEHAIVTPDRPVPGQPGLLHRQRLRRHRAVRLRAAGPGRAAAGPAGLSRGPYRRRSMRTPWIVGVSGASGTPVRGGGAARPARRRRAGRPGGVPGGPADHAGRDRAAVPRRALEGRPGRLARARTWPTPTWPTGRPVTWRPGPSTGSYPARGHGGGAGQHGGLRRHRASGCPRTCCSAPPRSTSRSAGRWWWCRGRPR